jgi:hypothetical protein
MHPPDSANDAFFASRQARSMPVLSSLSSVRGYPTKLKIYRISGSRFWQVRCFMNGTMVVRSTRVIEKQLAIEVAKKFYEELIVKHNLWGEDDVARMDAPRKMAEKIRHTFESVADKAIEQERGRMMRGELSLQSFKSLRSRFKKQIIPFFVKISAKSAMTTFPCLWVRWLNAVLRRLPFLSTFNRYDWFSNLH